jgi:serpin B
VAADGSVTLRAPSIVCVQSWLRLRLEFTRQVGDAAAAAIAQVGFAEAPEAARDEINRVIAEQTAGKITGLLPTPAITGMTRLVLTSAIYLKAAGPSGSPRRPPATRRSISMPRTGRA